MKRLFLSAVAAAVIGLAGSANAADLGTRPTYKAPPIVAPVPLFTWTGCYIGGDIASVRAHKHYFEPEVGGRDVGSHNATGAMGGGQLGCDYQIGNWILGAQGMFDWAHVQGSSHYAPSPKFIEHTLVSWMGTVTGRIGYVVQPAALIYLKGGAAWIRDKHWETYDLIPVYYGDAHVTRGGWTVGGGLEYMFHPGWSAFVEYDYMNFGTRDVTLTYTPATVGFGFLPTYVYTIKQNVQAILIGLNYRFGWGKAPIAARY